MRRALVALVAVVAVVLAVAQRDLAISIGHVKARLMPKATVENRLRSYEDGARERLVPFGRGCLSFTRCLS